MTFHALIAVVGLTAALFITAAVRNVRRRRLAGALLQVFMGTVLILIAAAALVVDANLRAYRLLSSERTAGTLHFTSLGYHQFNGVFTFPSGETADFELRGDAWQVDARMLKWRGLAELLGFDTLYRLDRISGRYTRIEDERSMPRTVYALHPAEHVDLWQLANRYHSWLPWIDATYGSATYLPMADGADYAVTVSPSGLIARPLNQAAAKAVGSWH